MDSENYNNRLTSQELFKVKLALSCLSNRVTVCPVQAKLYLLKGESWKLHKTGVAAVVLNTGESGERNPKGVKLSLVELESGFPSWNEELSDSSQYKAQDNKFHTLVLNNNNGAGNMAGLQFEEEGAASLFLKEIVDSIDELKSSNNTNELSKLEISSRKEKIKKFRKLRKSEISTPCLFTHVTNISSTQADTLDEPSTSDSNSDRRDSRSGSTSGQRDTVLNEEGKEQVKLVSKRLKDENFTKVFSSDLQRALKTAEGICTCNTFCGDLQICEEPLLRERNYSQVEGQPCAELKKLAQLGKIPNGAETHEQLDKRAVIFFRNLLEELYQSKKEQNDAEEITINQAISCQCDNRQITRDVDKHVVEHNHTRDKDMSENVLVVSHGGWIRSLIKYFAKDLPSQFPLARSLLTRQISPNTGITSFKLTVNGTEVNSIECLKLYDKSHLT